MCVCVRVMLVEGYFMVILEDCCRHVYVYVCVCVNVCALECVPIVCVFV